MFIVFEGLDGCGKTTHAQRVFDWLTGQGREVLLTAEPSKNRIGLFIREILSGTEEVDPETLALLFTADRCEHLAREVKPALDEGRIVLMERYVYSTIAYQAAQGVSKEWIAGINDFAVDPDLTIFLDLSPEIATKRSDSEEIFENLSFQERVYKEYLGLGGMVVLDGGGGVDAVFEGIKAEITSLLDKP